MGESWILSQAHGSLRSGDCLEQDIDETTWGGFMAKEANLQINLVGHEESTSALSVDR